MKTHNKTQHIILILFCIMLGGQTAQAQKSKFNLTNFSTEDGGEIEGALFKGSTTDIVLFAHGAVFNKESWYPMAELFQYRGISSLCIDFRGYGKSTSKNDKEKFYDILGAVDYLKSKNYKNIYIIGGSMGGAAILNAMEKRTDPLIQKIVLLAPAGGSPLKNKDIEKLFIISKEESLYHKVQTLYKDSSKKKTIKVYTGKAHAQHMFKEPYGKELSNFILEFILE